MNNDLVTRIEQARLTDAQRRYLMALEPNRVDPGEAYWQAQFQNRSHRKPIKNQGLATAHVLIRKGLVKRIPEPCECGFHYASLTELGLELQAALRARTSMEGQPHDQ